MTNKQKHHFVQKKYIAQWHNPNNHNQLSVFNHTTGEIRNSGANSKQFWEKDYNILASSKEYYYLPEEVSSEIDDKGIIVIRKLNELTRNQLSNTDRSTLAIYTALQYLRTPRYREETDEFFNATLSNPFKEYVKSQGGIKISKEDLLKEGPGNAEEEKIINDLLHMTHEEFQSHIPTEKDIEGMKMGLTTEGHSKLMLKAPIHGEKIYEFQWIFFIAPKDTSFVTSDNPCFTISRDDTRSYSGLCSGYAITILPISPSVLLYIDNSKLSHYEIFCDASKEIVRGLNRLIVSNSYDCVVAEDAPHLKHLLTGYKHRKNKEGKVRKMGDYSHITIE